MFAIHDLAALAEGNLSPEGMRRLAAHVMQCAACRAVLAAIVDDSQLGGGTGDLGIAAWLARVRVAGSGSITPPGEDPDEGSGDVD